MVGTHKHEIATGIRWKILFKRSCKSKSAFLKIILASYHLYTIISFCRGTSYYALVNSWCPRLFVKMVSHFDTATFLLSWLRGMMLFGVLGVIKQVLLAPVNTLLGVFLQLFSYCKV